MDLGRLRWVRYYFSSSDYPIYLIFFVTSRCIGRCRHCFYWRELNKEEKPLSIDEIEKTAKSIGRLLEVIFTGGEPLLRDDLAEVIKIFYIQNQPFSMGLATSGYFPDRLIQLTERVLKECPLSNFTVGLPIEGPEELNDSIRGVAGFFNRTKESIIRLKELKKRFVKLTILVDLTISKFNQDHLFETYRLIRDELEPDLINPIITRGEPKEKQALEVDGEKILKLFNLIDEDIKVGKIPGYKFFTKLLKSKDTLLRKMALEIYKGKKVNYSCRAGELAGVIYPEGELYPCELWKSPIGYLREADYNIRSLFKSENAKRIRDEIKAMNCQCYHQCFLSPSLFFDLKNLAKIAIGALSIK